MVKLLPVKPITSKLNRSTPPLVIIFAGSKIIHTKPSRVIKPIKPNCQTGKVAAFWLILTYLLHTCGELSLSPVGLSAVTKLSPVKIVGFMMGVWFLATASSEFIAGVLANIASIDTSNGTAPDLNLAKQSYLKLFEYLFYTGIGFGLLLLVLSPVIKKLMHGVDKELNN